MLGELQQDFPLATSTPESTWSCNISFLEFKGATGRPIAIQVERKSCEEPKKAHQKSYPILSSLPHPILFATCVDYYKTTSFMKSRVYRFSLFHSMKFPLTKVCFSKKEPKETMPSQKKNDPKSTPQCDLPNDQAIVILRVKCRWGDVLGSLEKSCPDSSSPFLCSLQ